MSRVTLRIRPARPDDDDLIGAVVDEWWGGREMRALLQPLFLEHFAPTSLVAEDDAGLGGFLVGFASPARPGEAYVHFVGVRPDLRGSGLGRELHDRFAAEMAGDGRPTVRCITHVVNERSVAFHTAIGFAVDGRHDDHVLMSRTTTTVAFRPRTDARPDDVPWPQAGWPPAPGTVLRGRTVELTTSDPDADAAGLFAALDDPRVWAHVAGRPSTAEDMAALVRWKRDQPSWWPWTVRLLEPVGGWAAGDIVGTTSYLEVAPVDARGEIGSTTYATGVWGTRVNPECKLLLLAYAFEQAGFGRMQLKTDVRNHRSQQAIARLGARYEGVLRRYQRRADGSVRDTVIFSTTAEEWPAVQAALLARLASSESAGRIRLPPGG